jgi:hypothetical protein
MGSRKLRADPLQLINDPTVLDSRQLMPEILAVVVQAANFPVKSKHMIAIVNPQVMPASSVR